MPAAFPGSDEYDASTYGEGFADVYDDWYGNVSDADATVAAIERLAGGGPVLELGVGTGRLALPLAEAGLQVTGVDASPAMLARLRSKPGHETIELVEADMADLPVTPGHFAVAFAAFNTFFNLTTAAAQRDCLTSVAKALRPDGLVVIEGFVPPPDGLSDGGVSVREVTSEGAVITVSQHDANVQAIRGQHIELTAAGNVLRPWVLHYSTPAQLDEHARAAGLVAEARWADWSGAPADATTETQISVYRRPL